MRRHLPGRAMGRNGGAAPDLASVAALLPTPNTMDSLPARTLEQVKARNRGNGDHGGSPRNLRGTVVNELRGEPTSPPSADGNGQPAAPLPGQLSLDGLESA